MHKQLNNTDLQLSALGLGTGSYGTAIPATDAYSQLDTYLDMGGNLIDTAHVYGDWASPIPGISEVVIGDWLKKTGKRNQVVISTKGAHPRLNTMDIPRCSPSEIMSDLDASLKNLQLDCIDMYYLHRDDPSIEAGLIINCLENAVKQGKIRYYACSNWTLERMEKALEYSKKMNYTGFVCNQIMWSLADIKRAGIQDKSLVLMDKELYSYHEKTDLGLMAYSASAGGYFTKMAKGKVSDSLNEKYQTSANDHIYNVLMELHKESGISISALSLMYIMHHPFSSVALASFSNLDQLKESVSVLEEKCPPGFAEKFKGLKEFVI